ncbi:MAG: hypothetical protein HEQ35_00570 [Gloeotrichia echinulata IR180]|jgi:hypothetical protein
MLSTIFCALCAWTIFILLFWSIWNTLKQGVIHVKRLHQIPCHKCDFFTNDYRLKCTVNPIIAGTEEAIACRDFELKTASCNACQKRPRPGIKMISKQSKVNLPALSDFNTNLLQ